MGLVRGEDVILSLAQLQGLTEVYVPFGCARSVTFDISTDFIETSVTESGAFKTFIPSGKQYSGNIEGLVFLDKPAVAETRATVTIDYSDLVDSGFFPCIGATALIDVVDPPGSILTICNTSSAAYSSLSDYLTAINSSINGSGTGYTSIKVGNTIIVTARPGVGATINGNASYTRYNIDGNVPAFPGYITDNFSGGIDAYYPSKIQMGLLYDKLITGEKIQIKYYETDDDNNFLYKVCNVYIESINETASFDNMATFTATFKGDGAPNISYGEI
jgi:hypothetical protein